MTVVSRALDLADRAYLLEVRRRGVAAGPGSRFSGRPVISLEAGSTIRLGARFFGQSRVRYQVLGVAHPCVIRTLHPSARILIGDDCGMSGGSIVAACSVEVGDGVLLGADAAVFDTDFHPVVSADRRYAPMPEPRAADRVLIGSNVFLGARAIVLPGTTIEDDCVVGAGAVVRGVVRAGSVVVGVPARYVGSSRIGREEDVDRPGDAQEGVPR